MTYIACFNNIISIKDPCATYSVESPAPASLSGYDLFDLPGISFKKANMIADEDYQTGLALLHDKRRLAILSIHSELLSVMNANNMIARGTTNFFNTSAEVRATAVNISQISGIKITNKSINCALKKMRIQNVYVSGIVFVDTNIDLFIEDGATLYTYPITLKAGLTTKVLVALQTTSETIRIYTDGGSVTEMTSVNPNCGCGLAINSCAAVVGFSGSLDDKKEAYGIWADVTCECDYSFLLCALSGNPLVGEIVLYKTGTLIIDEALKTDRLNYFTIYGKEDQQATKTEWENIYREKWNLLMSSLKNAIFQIDRCGCVECMGVAIKANI